MDATAVSAATTSNSILSIRPVSNSDRCLLVKIKRLQKSGADVGDLDRKSAQHRICCPGKIVDAMHDGCPDLGTPAKLRSRCIGLKSDESFANAI